MRGGSKRIFVILLLTLAAFAAFTAVSKHLRHKAELRALKRSIYTVPIVWPHPRLNMFFKCVVAFTPYQKQRVFTVPLDNDVDGYFLYGDKEKDFLEVSIDTSVMGKAYVFFVDTAFVANSYVYVDSSGTYKGIGAHVAVIKKRAVDAYMSMAMLEVMTQ